MPTVPERCEAMVVDHEDRHPHLLRCGKPGRLVKKYLLPYGVVLCTECEAVMESKYGSK